ncbi:P-loop containing nucleoside triphosphate hydrolase protein, partial [Lentinus brumalis]
PDAWQLELILRVLRGFDAIVCAGTGYGKSLVFEGLAVLGGKNKVVIVISPLKALEHDQVRRLRCLWDTARTTAQLLYLSPEMAQSDGFAKLWKNNQFRRRLQAVAVDEAHCVEEWGTDDFRPQYRSLYLLRHYTGQEIPFVAFTATCMTSTFE